MERQIELWETSYISKYPELLQKQLHDYASMGMSWRKLAGEKVFPHLRNYLPVMEEARENLLEVVPATLRKASEALEIDLDVIFVIYVGIGCGAGWSTRYRSTPAVLLGLENIAELGWSSRESLEALVAHELGHLAHMAWRNEWDSFAQAEKDPLFQLYSEGFAQRCEHIIQGADTWHRYQAQDDGWLLWCLEHKAWLAGEYLRRCREGLPVNEFFGSWLDIQGKKHTGYFLGHELVRWLQRDSQIKTIATLSVGEVKSRTKDYLRIAATDATERG